MKYSMSLVALSIILTGCVTTPPSTIEVNKPAAPKKPFVAVQPLPVVTPAVATSEPVIAAATEEVAVAAFYSPSTHVGFNEECGNVARSVNSFALLRDNGIGLNNALLMVKSNGDFPLGHIAREVFARRDLTPQVASVNTYQTCIKVSYPSMRTALYAAETKANAEIGKLMTEELQSMKSNSKKASVKHKK